MLHKLYQIALLLALLLWVRPSTRSTVSTGFRNSTSHTHTHTHFFSSFFLPPSQPSHAQFGIAGKNKKKTQFQQEQEKQAAAAATTGSAGGGLADMLDLQSLQDLMSDPEAMKQLESMGASMTAMMEQVMNMPPEELAEQMKQFTQLLTGANVVEGILENRNEVLKQLEASNMVPAEELAKMKADPEYFELKMRESLDQMGSILENPDIMQTALGQMQEALSGSGEAVMDALKNQLDSDDKIEEMRLEILKGENPLLANMFEGADMQAILNDPKKWRDTIKEGTGALLGGLTDEL